MAEKGFENVGAWILGRNMFGPVRGPWPDDTWKGWWGDDPPYHVPVFVLTHHARPAETKGDTEITFVTEGADVALAAAREAAGEKDVHVAGGAEAAQQLLARGDLDVLQIHIAPVLLGGGVRLFADGVTPKLELTRTVESPAVTHLWYRYAG
jgi:dihydrofolate reductase